MDKNCRLCRNCGETFVKIDGKEGYCPKCAAFIGDPRPVMVRVKGTNRDRKAITLWIDGQYQYTNQNNAITPTIIRDGIVHIAPGHGGLGNGSTDRTAEMMLINQVGHFSTWPAESTPEVIQ